MARRPRRPSPFDRYVELMNTPAEERLLSGHFNKQMGLAWPKPMYDFLKQLADKATMESGKKIPRSKIAAAAIVKFWMRDPNPQELKYSVYDYRQASVGDILPEGAGSSTPIENAPIKKFGLLVPDPVFEIIRELTSQPVSKAHKISQRELTATAIFELGPATGPDTPDPGELVTQYDQITLAEVFPGV